MAPYKKLIGGKEYILWLTIGKGNSKEFVDGIINKRRAEGSYVRVIKAAKWEHEFGRLAYVYVRSRKLDNPIGKTRKSRKGK